MLVAQVREECLGIMSADPAFDACGSSASGDVAAAIGPRAMNNPVGG